MRLKAKIKTHAIGVLIDETDECKEFLGGMVSFVAYCLTQFGEPLPPKANDIDIRALGNKMAGFFDGREALIQQNETLHSTFNDLIRARDVALARVKELEGRAVPGPQEPPRPTLKEVG